MSAGRCVPSNSVRAGLASADEGLAGDDAGHPNQGLFAVVTIINK